MAVGSIDEEEEAVVSMVCFTNDDVVKFVDGVIVLLIKSIVFWFLPIWSDVFFTCWLYSMCSFSNSDFSKEDVFGWKTLDFDKYLCDASIGEAPRLLISAFLSYMISIDSLESFDAVSMEFNCCL